MEIAKENMRRATIKDAYKIEELYKAVAKNEGGLIRMADEITPDYVQSFIKNSLADGLIIVAEHPTDKEKLIAEIHAHRPGIKVLNHILYNLTIVVHPDWQSKGIGRKIFAYFLETVSTMPDISRVELISRESNQKAIKFYQSLGFKIEGKFENRIKTSSGKFIADIPMAWSC